LPAHKQPATPKSQSHEDEDGWKDQSVYSASSKRNSEEADSLESGEIEGEPSPPRPLPKKTAPLKSKHEPAIIGASSQIAAIKEKLKKKALKQTGTTTLRPTDSSSSLPSIKNRPFRKNSQKSVHPVAIQEENFWTDELGEVPDPDQLASEKEELYVQLKPSQKPKEAASGVMLKVLLPKKYRIHHETQKKALEKLTAESRLHRAISNLLASEETECLCHQMCPDLEVTEREQHGEIESFERSAASSSLRPVKKFKRSAADTQLNEARTIRPPFILLRTVQYLVETVVPLIDRSTMMEAFDFVDNRFRAVCQDFTILFGQRSEELADVSELFRSSKESILSYETMVKFYVVMLNDIRFNETVDEFSVLKPLSGVLKTLIESYHEARRLQDELAGDAR
jgi:hypothetical protein